jgi:hypothetical protein
MCGPEEHFITIYSKIRCAIDKKIQRLLFDYFVGVNGTATARATKAKDEIQEKRYNTLLILM